MMWTKSPLLVLVILGVLTAGLVGAASAAAEEPQPAKAPANPNAVPNPVLVKVPLTFSGLRMENTPVMFQGRPMLVQNFRSGDVKAAGFYLFVEDLVTSQELARFGETFSFVSAFVNGDQLNVFATENTDDDWTHDIYRFSSTDLKNWNKELAIKRHEGEHLFNASVCKDVRVYQGVPSHGSQTSDTPSASRLAPGILCHCPWLRGRRVSRTAMREPCC